MRSSSRRGWRPKIYFDLRGWIPKIDYISLVEPVSQENLGERVQRSEPHTRVLDAPSQSYPSGERRGERSGAGSDSDRRVRSIFGN